MFVPKLCILCVNIIIIYIYTVFEPGIEKGETHVSPS